MTRLTAALAGLALVATVAIAAPEPLPQGGDPYLPRAARKAPAGPSPSGEALQALVEQKLHATFDAAAAGASGLTREQARRAGWEMVVQEFDRIDTTRSGRVSFEDIRRFVRSRAAAR